MKKEAKANTRAKVPVLPLADRVLIKEVETEGKEERTSGGIFIPETAKADHGSKRGTVLAVGPGRMDDGVTIPMSVKVGDTVLYQWGDTVKVGSEEYVMVSESNILAVIK
ncbi:co-chaperone GroES [Patescibacteria group bacterium]|nr:co-chaperone GroES [Patescibacteria group bacterium]